MFSPQICINFGAVMAWVREKCVLGGLPVCIYVCGIHGIIAERGAFLVEATKPGGYHRWGNILTFVMGKPAGLRFKRGKREKYKPTIFINISASHVKSCHVTVSRQRTALSKRSAPSETLTFEIRGSGSFPQREWVMKLDLLLPVSAAAGSSPRSVAVLQIHPSKRSWQMWERASLKVELVGSVGSRFVGSLFIRVVLMLCHSFIKPIIKPSFDLQVLCNQWATSTFT